MPQTHQDYVNAVKKSAVAVGKKALVTALTKKLPYLFVPFLNPITTVLIEKLVTILVEDTEFEIFFEYIDLRVDGQGRSFSEAAIHNYNVQQTGTPEEKLAAEKALIEKFRAFAILKN